MARNWQLLDWQLYPSIRLWVWPTGKWQWCTSRHEYRGFIVQILCFQFDIRQWRETGGDHA